ncbi:hypothetical protein ONS79_08670 [Aeromonas hydrophila subsp. hydrophila]|uniref:hypothetical protein n=1 Tax=Aeromonas hydrophila TaxID=644 RepID=UPI0023F319CC|nr:hypothetical protein [Aeromonas hydrophila]MDF5703662.1 hypothetical protein [Aeromonas hydrophila subsp. hydrophila]
MTYDIPWSIQSIAYAVLMLFILPVVFTSGSEFIFTKRLSFGVSMFSLALGGMLLMIGTLQIVSSKVIIDNNSITLSSLMYNETFIFNDIEHVSDVYDMTLPRHDKPTLRKNGIGLLGYNAGTFRFSDNKTGFVMMATPPYLVIELKGGNRKAVFSADRKVHEEIRGHLTSLVHDNHS